MNKINSYAKELDGALTFKEVCEVVREFNKKYESAQSSLTIDEAKERVHFYSSTIQQTFIFWDRVLNIYTFNPGSMSHSVDVDSFAESALNMNSYLSFIMMLISYKNNK